MIPVTKPYLPPKQELFNLLDGVYNRNWLTNHGPLVNQLEEELPKELNYQGNFFYVNNGTIALQIAIKALELTGEVITTPYSYVATTSSIVWENCTPIFVDVDITNCNINANLIESAITPNTSAILATHVYGNPCEVEIIQKIANKYNLKVIYDAAHCFGTTYKEKSIFEYGDISTASFHATKLFHTVEGGGIFTNNKNLAHKISYMRNFGHNGQEAFWGVGINGKNSEFHAAMGVVNLKYKDEILNKRKEQWLRYHSALNEHFKVLKLIDVEGFNYAYFPIFMKSTEDMKSTKTKLEALNIYCRRYFYPSLNNLPYIEQGDSFFNSNLLSNTVLTIPLYHTLTIDEQLLIIKTLKDV